MRRVVPTNYIAYDKKIKENEAKNWKMVSIYFGTSLQVMRTKLSWLQQMNASAYFCVIRKIL